MYAFQRKIVHLSSSPPSRAMRKMGVYELPTVQLLDLQECMKFISAPSRDEIERRAKHIAAIAEESGAHKAVIDVPAFMVSAVEEALARRNIAVVYPWGKVCRYLVETPVEDVYEAKCRFDVTDLIETGVKIVAG